MKSFKFEEFIDIGNPSPLWHACNESQFEIVQLLLEKKCKFNTPAPDGTTPFMVASLHGDHKIIGLFAQTSILQADTTMNDKEASLLIPLSRHYPKFNEDIEEDDTVSLDNNAIEYKELQAHITSHFCPMKKNWIEHSKLGLYDASLNCDVNCQR